MEVVGTLDVGTDVGLDVLGVGLGCGVGFGDIVGMDDGM